MAIIDKILLARSLLDSVSSILVGTDIAPDSGGDDDEGYECVEDDSKYEE